MSLSPRAIHHAGAYIDLVPAGIACDSDPVGQAASFAARKPSFEFSRAIGPDPTEQSGQRQDLDHHDEFEARIAARASQTPSNPAATAPRR